MSYQSQERKRLVEYARKTWEVEGPFELADRFGRHARSARELADRHQLSAHRPVTALVEQRIRKA